MNQRRWRLPAAGQHVLRRRRRSDEAMRLRALAQRVDRLRGVVSELHAALYRPDTEPDIPLPSPWDAFEVGVSDSTPTEPPPPTLDTLRLALAGRTIDDVTWVADGHDRVRLWLGLHDVDGTRHTVCVTCGSGGAWVERQYAREAAR